MSKRRITWLIHNAMMTPFLLIRIPLFAVYKIGQLAEWLCWRIPAWRMYDGWRGW